MGGGVGEQVLRIKEGPFEERQVMYGSTESVYCSRETKYNTVNYMGIRTK